MTKYIFAVSFLKNIFVIAGFAIQDSEQAILEDGGIELWLDIVAVLKIVEDNNAGLGLNRLSIFVWFND